VPFCRFTRVSLPSAPAALTRLQNNAPSAINLTAGNRSPLTENDQYYFFQDDFKLRPNLT
jgi:hypothetical protein